MLEKLPPRVLVDVGGVGYDLEVPMSTYFALPDLGQPVVLLTHLVVREDAHLLYGFLTDTERRCFRELVKVSGVGPRMALAVLSGLSPDELAQAVAQQSTARLVKVPGIGKKTAERLLLELKDKLASAVSAPASAASDVHGDVLQALVALGYSDKEASAAVRQLAPGVGVSDGIKQALRSLT